MNLTDGTLLSSDVEGVCGLNIKVRLGSPDLINAAFQEFLSLPTWDDDEEIQFDIKDGVLNTKGKMVRGSHPALRYRGNALKRHKIWFQKEGSHFYVYKYTGWQKRVLMATFRLDRVKHPCLYRLVEDLEKTTPQNHWICTLYEDGNDYIGMHSDKTHTWNPGSSFLVQKWGHPRRFVIALQDHADVDKCTVIFDKILPSGTKVLVDSDANVRTRHGVPPMEGDIGPSGSIVGRHIAEKISFDAADKMVQQAIQDRRKRQLKKTQANGRKKARKGTL